MAEHFDTLRHVTKYDETRPLGNAVDCFLSPYADTNMCKTPRGHYCNPLRLDNAAKKKVLQSEVVFMKLYENLASDCRFFYREYKIEEYYYCMDLGNL